MMRKMLFSVLTMCCAVASGQQNLVYAPERIRSLQLIYDGDPLLPPVMTLGKHKQFELSFDEMGHHYNRLVYHIRHCDYRWQKDSESLFESDYLEGLNGQLLEDYDTSFNTTQLYTHYSFTFPSRDLALRLSGNYCIEVYDEDEYNHATTPQPLLSAEFCVAETTMSVAVQVSSNTDIDFNSTHQQLTYSVSYGSVQVVDPLREIHTVVRQNRRQDNAVVDLEPNIRKATGMEFTHRKELIFDAGNEFHKFETIDMHRANLNIDNLRWYEPFYHFTVYPDRQQRNYVYDEDANGSFILRNAEYDDEETTSEYAFVHFTLQAEEPLPNDVYVCGLWTNGTWDPECQMQWDNEAGEYRAALFLKQGYYNYQYRQLSADGTGSTAQTDGNFHETENEYSISVYYRKQGDRYDRLVGYTTVNTSVSANR